MKSREIGAEEKDFLLSYIDEYFEYSEKDKGFIYKKLIPSYHNGNYVGKKCGSINPVYGYVAIKINGTLYREHKLVWLLFYGVMPTTELDHKNRNNLDNRIKNLRESDRSQNCGNRKMWGEVKYKGVNYKKDRNAYEAHIKINKKSIYLGYFKNPEDAAMAYDKAAMKYYRDFASTNFGLELRGSPLYTVDGYKVCHYQQYPKGTTLLYSNLTPRSSKLSPIPTHLFDDQVVVFGIQLFIKEFLIDRWDEKFFFKPKDDVIRDYQRVMDGVFGEGVVTTDHIAALHDLGYLPICIKALPEGSKCPIKVPMLTIYNTHPDFAWLTNYLETALSSSLWKMCTVATIAHAYRKLFVKYAEKTGTDKNFVQFQGHDFSSRGMSGHQDAATCGMAHLLSFVGSDSIGSIEYAENYYNSEDDNKKLMVCCPAGEHSTTTANILHAAVSGLSMREAELDFLRRYITEIYPSGLCAYVADSFDYWWLLSEGIPQLKDVILSRNGCLSTRPDSGEPVAIVCGEEIEEFDDLEEAQDDKHNETIETAGELSGKNCTGDDDYEYTVKVGNFYYKLKYTVYYNRHDKTYYYVDQVKLVSATPVSPSPEQLGSVEVLWNTFGGTLTETGHKLLDSHVRIVYGDSITLERAEAILKRLEAKGFASGNVIFGIGSYTYNHLTRDNFGFAVKATNLQVGEKSIQLYKDPATDKGGSKKSAKGYLTVQQEAGKLVLHDQMESIDTPNCLLREVFRDGTLLVDESFAQIRERLANA